MAMSIQRANASLNALKAALGFTSFNVTWANGLGERFADEYFQEADNRRDGNFRGTACYLWESFTTAIDPILQLEVKFASPPMAGAPRRRAFLAPLHMGRFRAQPRSPFA
jgi:hypothetical protein